MDSRVRGARPPRSAVLIVARPDHYIEIFAEPHIDAKVVRIPAVANRANEALAEDVAELMMPRRYRALYRRDFLRCNDTLRPLTIEAAHEALRVSDAISSLHKLAEEFQESELWAI